MMITGGHSAMGLLAAREASGSGLYPFVTTVSKRGRPDAFGPAAAVLEAMGQQPGGTPHYMAKCNVEDPVAFKCLWEWAPGAAASSSDAAADGADGASAEDPRDAASSSAPAAASAANAESEPGVVPRDGARDGSRVLQESARS
eukprot:TRINITY_DN72997_c0_g1_i1.p1 TRINITY_DN72997_c0_g1~~TRINITY_DN72997_c0_g1_i1.p1  ORF type:complete len:144 (-),score=37.16 TRINITY_DN72997_c0_g1_i1:60-491(-)